MLTKEQRRELEEAEPKNRIEELEWAMKMLSGARQSVDRAEEEIGKSLLGLRVGDDGPDGFYWFLTLLGLESAGNTIREAHKSVHSRRFVDA
jgi:hypothetical protein